ncbi:hypothetical protein CBL_12558 [Carabus blaptoides fortunei]
MSRNSYLDLKPGTPDFVPRPSSRNPAGNNDDFLIIRVYVFVILLTLSRLPLIPNLTAIYIIDEASSCSCEENEIIFEILQDNVVLYSEDDGQKIQLSVVVFYIPGEIISTPLPDVDEQGVDGRLERLEAETNVLGCR